eukprot:1226821-Pleurochrysis_carterae.AAC.1
MRSCFARVVPSAVDAHGGGRDSFAFLVHEHGRGADLHATTDPHTRNLAHAYARARICTCARLHIRAGHHTI